MHFELQVCLVERGISMLNMGWCSETAVYGETTTEETLIAASAPSAQTY
jgi:hypothetical protein